MRGLLAQEKDKSTFTYWHANYDTPALMEFKGVETVYDVETYRYQAHIIADQTHALSLLPGVGSTRGVSVNATLDVWIEPYSGILVKYEDVAEAGFYDLKTQKSLLPWNHFRNEYTAESIFAHAQAARFERNYIQLFTFYLPLACLAAILVILGACYAIRYLRSPDTGGVARWHGHLRVSRHTLVIAGVSVLFLSVAVYSWIFVSNLTRDQERKEFFTHAQETQRAIENRLDVYADLLYSGRSLFAASEKVERDEWKSFIGGQRIVERFPGLQGIGYVSIIPRERLAEHVREMKAAGFLKYEVTPAGSRDVYTAITFIEPFDRRNKVVIGYDMTEDRQTRGPAMAFARDTGELALSGKVRLLQEIDEDVQPGFLMYVPVYANGLEHATIQDRRQNIQGYVYSPFRAYNFMNEILANTSSDIVISLYDGPPEKRSTDDLLYTNELPQQKYFDDGAYAVVEEMVFGGRTWTVEYRAGASYGSSFVRTALPLLVLSMGIFLALFIAVLMHVALVRREQSARLAQGAIIALTEEKMLLKAVLQTAREAIAVADNNGMILSVNRALVELCGWSEPEVHGREMNKIFALRSRNGEPLASAEYPSALLVSQERPHQEKVVSGVLCATKSGEQVRMNLKASPVFLAGRLIGVVQTFEKEGGAKV
jgi:PAS domain S-box-containing protein